MRSSRMMRLDHIARCSDVHTGACDERVASWLLLENSRLISLLTIFLGSRRRFCCSRHPVFHFRFRVSVPLAVMDSYDQLSKEEEVVAILASVSVLTPSTVARQQRKKQRWWVRPSLHSREVANHAGRLLPELQVRDVEYYRKFFSLLRVNYLSHAYIHIFS